MEWTKADFLVRVSVFLCTFAHENPKGCDQRNLNFNVKMDMKKIQVLLVCLLAAVALQAQTSAKAKARMTEVKKLYAEAKERMAYNDQEDYPAVSGMETTYYYMAAGAGPIKHYIKYYIDSEETDEGEVLSYRPYFFSDSYNSGARKIYEEYLVDEKTGTLLFAYAYEENGDGTKNEGRYYYYKDGSLAHKDVKVNTELGAYFDETYMKTRAARLTKALGLTMND